MMFKWRNMRALVFLAAVILGISSGLVYLSVPRPGSRMVEYGGFSIYTPSLVGQEVSLDQAQASVPFKINLPTNIGAFVQLRLVKPPEADREMVIAIYATKKPSSSTPISDLDKDAIVLTECRNLMTLQESVQNILDIINSTKNDVGGGAQVAVTINGYLGCAGGNVAHVVTWYTETTEYRLEANVNYPLQQLI
jgi:hypothetical protein